MIISFGELNKKLLLYIFVPLLIASRWLFENWFKIEKKNLFFNGFLRMLARVLNIIPWIFLEKSISFEKVKDNKEKKDKKDKKDKKESEKYSLNSESISEDSKSHKRAQPLTVQFEMEKEEKEQKMEEKNKIKRSEIIIIFLIGLLDFISISCHFIISELDIIQHLSGALVVLAPFIRIISLAILSYCLIKTSKAYKHHYCSGITIGIIIFLFLFSSFFVENENAYSFFVKLFIKAIPDIGFSFMYTIASIYLRKTNGNIYRLLFFNGIIGIVLSIIIQAIFAFFNCHKNNYDFINLEVCDDKEKYITIIYNFKSFNNFGGFISIFIILTNFFENIAIFLLIYFFSLNHFAAIFIIPTYFSFIIEDRIIGLKILYFIGGIIIIFMTLVYNEIIILRFWGLETNTRIEIIKRANDEIVRNPLNELKDSKPNLENDDFI